MPATNMAGAGVGGDAPRRPHGLGALTEPVTGFHPNPVKRRCLDLERGVLRNLWCPYYSECLTRATTAWWWDFSCQECAHRRCSDKPHAHELPGFDPTGWEDIWREGYLPDGA